MHLFTQAICIILYNTEFLGQHNFILHLLVSDTFFYLATKIAVPLFQESRGAEEADIRCDNGNCLGSRGNHWELALSLSWRQQEN